MLRTVKYGDSSIIIDMLTDERGRMSVITRRTSRPSADRGRIAPSHLMPLSLLEFDCNIHGQGRLPHPHTIICYHPYTTLQSHPVKATLALFIAEFLSYALKEETANHLLYDYLEQSFRWLDTADRPLSVDRCSCVSCGATLRRTGSKPSRSDMSVPCQPRRESVARGHPVGAVTGAVQWSA